jgi:superfamily II DNA or RNA helicase
MALQLRNYQVESINQLRQGIADGHHRQVLCASTGAGKSVIMLSMIEGVIKKNKRVHFYCERRVLVEQFSRHLDAHGIDHGVLMSGHWRFRPDRNVQVVSIQTMEKYDHIDPPDLLFIDECHVAIRLSVAKLFEKYPTMKVIGATATPFSKKLPKYFSNVVSVITMRELIEQGNLVPFRVFAATEINTDGLKINSMGEFEEKAAEERATHIIGDVVADYWRIAMMVYGEPRKAIVFTSGIAHGTVLTEKFNQSGVMAMQITANNTEEEKKAMLDEFAKPDSAIKILLCSEMLERGFDVTDIDFVILAKAIKKSFSRFVQMIGRGARPHEGKGWACIMDHGSNWLRFSEQWQELYHNGVDSLNSDAEEVKKREPTKKEKEESRCPKCGMIWQAGDTCLACGHQRSRRSQVVTIAGEAQEIDSGTGKPVKKKEASKEDKQAFYSQALAFAHARGYSEGWAAHKYKTKFGVFPRSLDKVPAVAIGDEFLAFVQHQNIKYAKAKK